MASGNSLMRHSYLLYQGMGLCSVLEVLGPFLGLKGEGVCRGVILAPLVEVLALAALVLPLPIPLPAAAAAARWCSLLGQVRPGLSFLLWWGLA